MKLTDEQYQQVFRYVDGEMNASDQQAFETALAQHKELYEEVAFYRELKLLSASVEEKLCAMEPSSGEEKKREEAVRGILNLVRKNWESQQEEVLKSRNGITASVIPPSEMKLPILSRLEKMPDTWQAIIKKPGKRSRLTIVKWLVAAVLIGLLFSSIGWWYFQNKKEDAKSVSNTTNKYPGNAENKIVNNTDTDSQHRSTVKQNEDVYPENTDQQAQNKIAIKTPATDQPQQPQQQANDRIASSPPKQSL